MCVCVWIFVISFMFVPSKPSRGTKTNISLKLSDTINNLRAFIMISFRFS